MCKCCTSEICVSQFLLFKIKNLIIYIKKMIHTDKRHWWTVLVFPPFLFIVKNILNKNPWREILQLENDFFEGSTLNFISFRIFSAFINSNYKQLDILNIILLKTSTYNYSISLKKVKLYAHCMNKILIT